MPDSAGLALGTGGARRAGRHPLLAVVAVRAVSAVGAVRALGTGRAGVTLLALSTGAVSP